MGVIGNVVLAVAMVALAPGAVTEFQVGEFGVGAAADGAAVGVGQLRFLRTLSVGRGEGDYLGTGCLLLLLFQSPAKFRQYPIKLL